MRGSTKKNHWGAITKWGICESVQVSCHGLQYSRSLALIYEYRCQIHLYTHRRTRARRYSRVEFRRKDGRRGKERISRWTFWPFSAEHRTQPHTRYCITRFSAATATATARALWWISQSDWELPAGGTRRTTAAYAVVQAITCHQFPLMHAIRRNEENPIAIGTALSITTLALHHHHSRVEAIWKESSNDG